MCQPNQFVTGVWVRRALGRLTTSGSFSAEVFASVGHRALQRLSQGHTRALERSPTKAAKRKSPGRLEETARAMGGNNQPGKTRNTRLHKA
jgi:hypothetical protein